MIAGAHGKGMRMRRCLVAALAAGLAQVGVAAAAPLKGTVTLPAELKSARRHKGYWRVENGNVPVQAAATRSDTVVLVEGPKGQAPGAKTVTVDIFGLQATPSVVIIGEGSVVEFKNGDKVAHDLFIPDQSELMPLERLNPGALRRKKFDVSGAYSVRCTEYPHLTVSIIVVNSPYVTTVDDKGAFKLPDAPDGKATLKVWAHGKWVHEEGIEIGPKSGDLQIKVAGGAKEASD
jgi:plastocyanin